MTGLDGAGATGSDKQRHLLDSGEWHRGYGLDVEGITPSR